MSKIFELTQEEQSLVGGGNGENCTKNCILLGEHEHAYACNKYASENNTAISFMLNLSLACTSIVGMAVGYLIARKKVAAQNNYI